MVTRSPKTSDIGVEEKMKKTVEQAGDEACRCKETAEMTPRELLKLMMKDLAFWKKEKKS